MPKWIYIRSANRNLDGYIRLNGSAPGTLAVAKIYGSFQERRGRGALIAAAPELLDAVEALLTSRIRWYSSPEVASPFTIPSAILKQLEEAVKAARTIQ